MCLRVLTTVLLLVSLGSSISACGNKGPLYLPSGIAVEDETMQTERREIGTESR